MSKAINNSEGLAVTTRDKILQKAVEMGYKQFSYVKAAASFFQAAEADPPLSPAFQGEIALFTTVFLTQSHFASLMFDKFQREISQLGYIVNTHRVSEENLRSKSLPYTFRLEQVKGIICIEMFNRDYDEMICELGLPVLFVDGPPRIGGFSLAADQLYMENTTEITRFVCEALRRGDRRIGFIGNPLPVFLRALHRRSGTLLAEVCRWKKYCIRYNHRTRLPKSCIRWMNCRTYLSANDFVAETPYALCFHRKTIPGTSGSSALMTPRSPPQSSDHEHRAYPRRSWPMRRCILINRIKSPLLTSAPFILRRT